MRPPSSCIVSLEVLVSLCLIWSWLAGGLHNACHLLPTMRLLFWRMIKMTRLHLAILLCELLRMSEDNVDRWLILGGDDAFGWADGYHDRRRVGSPKVSYAHWSLPLLLSSYSFPLSSSSLGGLILGLLMEVCIVSLLSGGRLSLKCPKLDVL